MEQGDKYTEEEKKRKKRNQEKDIKTDAWISGCDGSNNPTEQRPLSNNRRVFFLNLKHVAINGSSPVRILFVTCILIAFFFFWIFLSQIKRFFTFTFAQLYRNAGRSSRQRPLIQLSEQLSVKHLQSGPRAKFRHLFIRFLCRRNVIIERS